MRKRDERGMRKRDRERDWRRYLERGVRKRDIDKEAWRDRERWEREEEEIERKKVSQ